MLQYHYELAQTVQLVEPLDLNLDPGERLVWTVETASLVELPDTVNLGLPVHEAYSIRVPVPYAIGRDEGFLAVTDQRLLFFGTKGQQEWAFVDLTEIGFGATDPIAMMRLNDELRPSGLLFTGDAERDFPLFICLALAVHAGDRAGFIAYLGEVLDRHEENRPPVAVPAPEPPYEQPVFDRPRNPLARFFFGNHDASPMRKFMPTLLTLLVLALVAYMVWPGRTGTTRTASEGVTEVPASSITPGTSTPEASPTSQAPASQSPSPQTTSKSPSPKPSTSKPVDLCGAPSNPWNFNFCGGTPVPFPPPAGFCDHFRCVEDFGLGPDGYIAECQDGTFSHQGGRAVSCTGHNGQKRPLFRA